MKKKFILGLSLLVMTLLGTFLIYQALEQKADSSPTKETTFETEKKQSESTTTSSQSSNTQQTTATSTNQTVSASNTFNTETSKTESDNNFASDAVHSSKEPPADWKENFEKDLYNKYHVTVNRYQPIGHNDYEVWVNEEDTGDNPFVTVNAVTGWFHG